MKIQTQLKIGKLTDDFRGESVYDGKRVILDGVIREDEAEVELNAYINGVYYGKVKRLVCRSPLRVKPECPYFYECGKCALQYMDYGFQKERKTKLVADEVKGAKVYECEGLYYPYRYRNRTSLTFSHSGGRIVIGYEAEKTGRVTDIEDCTVCGKWIVTLLNCLRNFAGKFSLKAFSPASGEGVLKKCRAMYAEGAVCLTLHTTVSKVIGLNWLMKELEREFGKAELYVFSEGFDTGAPLTYRVGSGRIPGGEYISGTRVLTPETEIPKCENLHKKLIKEIKDKSTSESINECRGVLSGYDFIRPDVKGKTLISNNAGNLEERAKAIRPDRVMFFAEDIAALRTGLAQSEAAGYIIEYAVPYDMLAQTKNVSTLVSLCRK